LYLIYFHVLAIGDSSYAEYMKEINPDWVAGESQNVFSLEYRSPLYNPEDDITPLSRLEAERAVQLRAQSEPVGDELVSKVSELDFEALIMAAMRIANQDELEKLQNSFPDIWQKVDATALGMEESAATASTTPVEDAQYAMEVLTDETSLAQGEVIFETNCATCHGKLGEGGIGPNLTDEYYLHGKGMSNIVRIIKQGVAAKGMISWRGILKDNQMQQVASYILSLEGTNPPNPKAPQGEKIEIAPLN
jgi:mono/diheme cytochrome c family protein